LNVHYRPQKGKRHRQGVGTPVLDSVAVAMRTLEQTVRVVATEPRQAKRREGSMCKNLKVRTVYSGAICQDIGIVQEGPYKDWLVVKHPDGEWVTLVEPSKYIAKPSPADTGDEKGGTR